MIRTAAIITLATVPMLVGCQGSDKAEPPTPSVPPAKAYPRLALPLADSLTAVGDEGLRIMVNPAANIVTEPVGDGASTAVTAIYPGLGIAIYYTLRRVKADEQQSEVDNRLERISLNLNGTPARTDFTAADCDAEGFIVETKSASLTPIQMLVAGNGYIVTGTAFIDNTETAAAYDSIRPLIDMIYSDMSRSVPNVKFVRQ